MEKMLLRWLGVLLCVLASCADIAPVANFDLGKMAGKWYIVGFATNSEWFVNHKAGMKVGTSIMTPTATGDMDLAYANLNSDGSCWRMSNLAKKTDTPGRFTFHSQSKSFTLGFVLYMCCVSTVLFSGWNNDNDMRIVDVVYDNYAMIHTIKTKDGMSEVLNKLYSRTPQASGALQQKFTQFSLGTGVQLDNIVILPPNAECPSV